MPRSWACGSSFARSCAPSTAFARWFRRESASPSCPRRRRPDAAHQCDLLCYLSRRHGRRASCVSASEVRMSSRRPHEALSRPLPRHRRPSLSRMSASGRFQTQLAELEKGALELKLRITAVALGDAAAVESAFPRIAEARAEAVVGTRGVLSTTYRKIILDRVSGSGLPAIFESSAYADEGGLLSYGIATEDNFRRAVSYVDKILKGAKAGELPIEQPAKLELDQPENGESYETDNSAISPATRGSGIQ